MNIGDKAPEVLGINEKGVEIRLSDYKGKKIVLYFHTDADDFITGFAQVEDKPYEKNIPKNVSNMPRRYSACYYVRPCLKRTATLFPYTTLFRSKSFTIQPI